jgi:hypothetical protein
MNSRALLEGAGCGMLITWPFVSELLSNHGNNTLFYHPFPISSVFLAALVDLVGIGILAAAIWVLLERLGPDNFLWAPIVAGIVAFAAYSFARVGYWRWLFAGIVLVSCGLRWYRAGWFRAVVRLTRGGLVLLGFSVFWMVPELLYFAIRSSGHEAPGFTAPTTVAHGVGGPRIVWLLFDELSYDQVFEHRSPSLLLPNFDRLRSQSVTFTNLEPAGFFTDLVVPSLLLGRTASDVKSSAGGEFSVYLADVRRWRRFDPSQTVFADAKALGWTSGIVGWYLPYCRVMQGWVDICHGWPYEEPFPGNMEPDRDILANIPAPFMNWLPRLFPGILSDRYNYRKNWVADLHRDYLSLMKEAQTLLADSAIRFAYVHLNVPHPPGFYDRKTHQLAAWGSYLDNVALADESLGRLIGGLESTPEWSETTVVACSDHSWRPTIWDWNISTAEDKDASKGRFEPRPALLVHFPAQAESLSVTSRFPALAEHDVIEALLRRQIRTPTGLAAWVAARTHNP